MSGVLKNDATLNNFNRGSQERFQHLQVMQGKTATAVSELHAGDIGAVAKLKETTTGETLGDKSGPIFYAPARIPEPSITFAVEPKTRADEDRIGQAIHKILEEDLALRFRARSADEGISAERRGAAAHRGGGGEAAQALSRGID
jgi:elongation factor G